MTPLHLAAMFQSSVKVVRMLLEAGANVNALDSYQSSALHLALDQRRRESVKDKVVKVVRVLIEAGADVNAVESRRIGGRSPLHLASEWGNPEAVPILLEAGARPNVLSEMQYSPLFLAAQHGYRYLQLDNGTYDRSTIVFNDGYKTAIAALMTAGADPYLGRSPLTFTFINDDMKAYISSLTTTTTTSTTTTRTTTTTESSWYKRWFG